MAQEESELQPELRPYAWMVGKWELTSIRRHNGERDSESTAHPINKWMQIEVGEQGELRLRYQYYASGANIAWGRVNDKIIDHTEAITMSDGQLVLKGAAQTLGQNGPLPHPHGISTMRYKISRDATLDELVSRGEKSDSLQLMSYRVAIHAKRVHSYANSSYQPFTPKTPNTRAHTRANRTEEDLKPNAVPSDKPD